MTTSISSSTFQAAFFFFRLLTQLGNTKEEVAATLSKEDCRGRKGKAYHCPVSNYLANKLNADKIMVGTHKATNLTNGKVSYQVPAPVREFILAFDAGKFPGLEK